MVPFAETFYGGDRTHAIHTQRCTHVYHRWKVYRKFNLDADEQGQDPGRYISIGMVKIYVGASGAGAYDPAGNEVQVHLHRELQPLSGILMQVVQIPGHMVPL